jgi:AP-1-like factor
MEQQQLLYQALTGGQQNKASPLLSNPNSFTASPLQEPYYDDVHGASFVDHLDNSFGPDASFDFDVSQSTLPNMTNDGDSTAKSDTTDNDSPEKRPRDDDEDAEEDAGPKDAKRRESIEKVPKKPGRKPLTSEPASVSSDFNSPTGVSLLACLY